MWKVVRFLIPIVRTLICQSNSEHIIRDDDMADVDGRTLTIQLSPTKFQNQSASWESWAGATAGNRMLTRFARRSAAIADAPEAPGCLGSGLASKPRPGRLGEAPGLGSGLGRGNPARGALRPRSLGRPPWGFLMG